MPTLSPGKNPPKSSKMAALPHATQPINRIPSCRVITKLFKLRRAQIFLAPKPDFRHHARPIFRGRTTRIPNQFA